VRVRFLRAARFDLVDIHEWIADRNGSERADRIVTDIEARVRLLEDQPLAGPSRTEVAEGLRGLVEQRWLVLYRVLDHEVQVVRVVDQARDLSRVRIVPDVED
jgi:toxin ParE1/3/4